MKRSHHIKTQLHRQRGSAAIWFALCLPVLIGFAALAIDLARLNLTKTELQNAADAAALAGARYLTPQVNSDYNWSAAAKTAKDVTHLNYANGQLLAVENATIDSGYWNLKEQTFQTTGGAGFVPAIRATVRLSNGQTYGPGPVKLFFAPILGITGENIQEASAVAVIAPAGDGTGIFPFAISKKMFDTYWDSTNNKPMVDSGNNPIELKYGLDSVYFDKSGTQYTSGTWTTFGTSPASSNNVKDYLEGTLTSNVKIGMTVNLESGVDDDAFHITGDLYTNKDVPVVVVENVTPGSTATIYAIAGFHIDSVDKIKGKSYISGHFISPEIFTTLNSGDGNGTLYGAYTPPILVE